MPLLRDLFQRQNQPFKLPQRHDTYPTRLQSSNFQRLSRNAPLSSWYTDPDVNYYGYTGDSGVCNQRKKLALKMSTGKELSVRFNKLTSSLSKYIVQA